MNEQAFRALIELVQFDQATHAIKTTIQTTNQALDTLRAEEYNLQQELDAAKHAFTDARKLVDEKELEAKELDQKESLAKQRLDTAKSHREYEALKSEVTQLQTEQHELESEILDAWNKLDAAEKAYKDMQQQHDEKRISIHNQITTLQERIETLKSEVSGRSAEHDQKASQVPAEWLEKYRAMGSHVSDPVVSIMGDACGGCFYQLISQDLLRLKRGALLQCKGCFRFLYDPQVMEQLP
jgi:predicted  nucleic acid-binding Zn-ribbon protein